MSSPQKPMASPPDWDHLPITERLLLLAVYFVEGLGLASLPVLFADTVWYVRVGIIAACILPQLPVYWWKPGLRPYLPGLLVALFGLFLGMLPGLVAEQAAEAAGAIPAVSKGLFVFVTAAVFAVVVRLAYRRTTRAGGSGED